MRALKRLVRRLETARDLAEQLVEERAAVVGRIVQLAPWLHARPDPSRLETLRRERLQLERQVHVLKAKQAA